VQECGWPSLLGGLRFWVAQRFSAAISTSFVSGFSR
jgi:hypothetical protein